MVIPPVLPDPDTPDAPEAPRSPGRGTCELSVDALELDQRREARRNRRHRRCGGGGQRVKTVGVWLLKMVKTTLALWPGGGTLFVHWHKLAFGLYRFIYTEKD